MAERLAARRARSARDERVGPYARPVDLLELPGDRLLAAGDPLLDGRDRASLVEDLAVQKEVWKAISSPGVVLADGEVVGTWRAKAKGRRLEVACAPLGGLRLPAAVRMAPEAEALAAARGLAGATLV